MHLAISARI